MDIDAAASADSVGGAINTTPDDLPTTSTSSCMPLTLFVCFFAIEVGFIMVLEHNTSHSIHTAYLQSCSCPGTSYLLMSG